jgi:hypothetical protein
MRQRLQIEPLHLGFQRRQAPRMLRRFQSADPARLFVQVGEYDAVALPVYVYEQGILLCRLVRCV